MLRAWGFHISTRIDFGPGRLRKLGQATAAFGRTALVVGYRNADALEPVYAAAGKSLGAAGVGQVDFAEITPEPTADVVGEGARRAVEAGADVVVALGGGSVLDAAKAIAMLAVEGATLADHTEAHRQSRPAVEALPLVAAPTTAGTGAEVTSLAIITQRGIGALGEAPVKTTVYGPALAPRVAIVDPEATWTCPARLTAACGADALAHAIEAYTSRRANPMAGTLAEAAIARIVSQLPQAVASPENADARQAMSLAALLAGMAIESAGATLGHSVAHALGALLHVPHGEAVALALPLNLRYNAPPCAEAYARLADVCGLGGGTVCERAERFVEHVIGLVDSFGLLEPVRVPHESPRVLIPRLAQNAMDGTLPPLRANPCPIDRPQLEAVLAQLFGRR